MHVYMIEFAADMVPIEGRTSAQCSAGIGPGQSVACYCIRYAHGAHNTADVVTNTGLQPRNSAVPVLALLCPRPVYSII